MLLDGPATHDVFDHEGAEVGGAIVDRRFGYRGRGVLAGQGGLSGGVVAIEAEAGCDDPVVQTLASLGEVLVPSQWRGATCCSS